jgi:bifunctional non-homologous end joining protein LigD
LVKPMLATLVEKAPAGDGWLHEVKFDGYRILARISGGAVRLISRRDLDWTPRFKAIADELTGLKVKAALLDGEVVALNPQGVSDFGALQEALSTRGGSANLVYYAFDLLHLDGYDLRGCPLEGRKAALAALLAGAPSRILYSEHHRGDGPAVYRSACSMKLEGIVSKRRGSTYQAGRSVELVEGEVHATGRLRRRRVHGAERGQARFRLASARLLRHCRQAALRRQGWHRLRRHGPDRAAPPPKRAAVSPRLFRVLPAGIPARAVHWVEPSLVAEVRYAEWTRDGSLRHPTFLRLREDKTAEEVVRASSSSTRGP